MNTAEEAAGERDKAEKKRKRMKERERVKSSSEQGSGGEGRGATELPQQTTPDVKLIFPLRFH